MKYLLIIILCITAIIAVKKIFFRYDKYGFDKKGIHKNGTRFDDHGFDVYGFNKSGFDRFGYNVCGYDKNGFNKFGYNYYGKNSKRQYNRYYDNDSYDYGEYSKDGFLNPRIHKIAVTTHARERISERIQSGNNITAEELAQEAYCFGKSARQIKKTSAALVEDIESRYGNGIVLIYRGYIYVFSTENVLITVYKNENIPL